MLGCNYRKAKKKKIIYTNRSDFINAENLNISKKIEKLPIERMNFRYK